MSDIPLPATTAAVLVNDALFKKDPISLVPAFHQLEDMYRITIRLTHTGIMVRYRDGMGKIVYYRGDAAAAKSAQARGMEECAAMRKFARDFLFWANNNMPCDEVGRAVAYITGE